MGALGPSALRSPFPAHIAITHSLLAPRECSGATLPAEKGYRDMTADRPLFYLALSVAVLAVLGILFPTVREFIGLSNRTDVVHFTLDGEHGSANSFRIDAIGPMPVQLVAEEAITVGQRTVLQGPSPSTTYGVVFEDDGTTGYLYGLDLSRRDNPIVDALHIYDVGQVANRAKPSVVQLVWSQDGLKAALLINRYPHAVFDFEGKRGYCRTGFPPASNKWTQSDHSWDDRALELFE
jgi:hypothetical protein